MHQWTDDDALIIDTDVVGLTQLAMDVDDDIALMMLLRQRRVVAITVTWGNAPARLCYQAAERLLQRLGSAQEIPLYMGSGCAIPLPFACPEPPRSPASEAIGRLGAAHPGKLTLVALGPLSNVAAAMRDHPALAGQLANLLIVGGSTDSTHANVARHLAANFYWLPDLASTRVVLGSSASKTLVTVETMARAHIDVGWLHRMGARCCPSSAVCSYLPSITKHASEARVMARLFPEWRVNAASWVPWDAIVATLVVRPDLFGDWHLLQVAIDWRGVSLAPPSPSLALASPSFSSSTAWRNMSRQPFIVAAPLSLNRSGCLDHLASTLCAVHTVAVETDQSWPIAWPNVAVAVLNRGVHALEPMVPGSAVLLVLVCAVVGFLGMLWCCTQWARQLGKRYLLLR